ncbi:tape measure protein [Acinetobacter radioresistens]|uniref:tape measure protein n=1 Tax=Acinetobacter radioresistens TaxID=40216 RepID=UPI00125FC4D6|nr:tape measure protein [Acinetobacter radioresistens]
MAGKELTFKIVMEADTKNYVSNIKESESVTKAIYTAIKQESEKLKAASEETAQEIGKIVPDDLQKKADQAASKINNLGSELQDTATKANKAGFEIGEAIPGDTIQLAEILGTKFFTAAKEIEALGDKSVISASELRSMSSIGEQGLNELNSALKAAQAELVRLQSTDGTLKDIEIAKQRVLSIEDAIKETSSAFNYYQDVAVNAMRGVDNATQSTINQLQQFSAVDLSGVIGEAQTVTRAIESMGSGATVSTREVQRIGELGSNAINALERELNEAKLAWQALSSASHDISLEELNQAKQKVERLEQALDLTENSMNEFKSATQQAVPVVDHLDQSLEKTNHELKDTETFGQQAASEVEGLRNSFNALTGVLAAVGIGTSAMEIAQVSDQYKTLSGRIQIAIGDNANLKQAMDDVANVAIKTNSNLVATGDLFARLTKIGQEMKWPQEQALALTETINRAIQVGGGSAEANEAAITQLNQALGSGVLRGDEFNSMVEQSPRLTQAMADGLGVTTGQLREMANQGQLTTAIVTKAILSQSEVITAEFNKFPATIGASIENLKTAWTIYIGEADAASGASAKVAQALKFVSQNLDALITTLTAAAQAFIAYKAIGMAAVFLEKANAAKAAQVAIATETVALTANTGANTANTRATHLTAVAKTELAAATNASTTANTAATGVFGRVTNATNGLKAGLVSVLSRFGAYGAAAAGVVIASDLMVDGFKTTDEWLLRQGSNFFDWAIARVTGTKSLAEQERDLAAAEEESRKKQEASTAAKEKHAAAAEKSRDKTYQLTEQSKKLITEFDGLIAKGEPAKEALEKVSQAMKFDSTKGINDAITALILLQNQGKITGEELQGSLGKALDGKDLVVFEANARAAFAGTSKEAEKNAQITEAVMKAALERTGLSTEQLQGKFSLAFQSATNDVQIILGNLDQYKQKGIDTGLALASNLNKAIDTAQTRAELDYAKSSLIALEKQGLITGEQAAFGLSLIEKKAAQLPAVLNPVEAAFASLGIKTKEQLSDAAISAQRNFDVVSKSGQATAEAIKQAYIQMLNAALATGDKAQIAAVQAKAASHGLQVQIDDTGKAVVQTASEWVKANIQIENSARGIKDGYREAGRVAREEAKSSTEAWSEALTAMQGKLKASKTGVMAKNGYSVDEIEQQLTEMGYGGNVKQKAKELFQTAQQGPGGYYRSASHEYAARYGVSAYDNQKQTGNYMYIAEQLEKLEEYAGKSGSVGAGSKAKTVVPEVNINSLAPDVSYPKTSLPVSDPARTVRYEFDLGNGKTATMYGSPNDGDDLESMLRKLEMIKKSS